MPAWIGAQDPLGALAFHAGLTDQRVDRAGFCVSPICSAPVTFGRRNHDRIVSRRQSPRLRDERCRCQASAKISAAQPPRAHSACALPDLSSLPDRCANMAWSLCVPALTPRLTGLEVFDETAAGLLRPRLRSRRERLQCHSPLRRSRSHSPCHRTAAYLTGSLRPKTANAVAYSQAIMRPSRANKFSAFAAQVITSRAKEARRSSKLQSEDTQKKRLFTCQMPRAARPFACAPRASRQTESRCRPGTERGVYSGDDGKRQSRTQVIRRHTDHGSPGVVPFAKDVSFSAPAKLETLQEPAAVRPQNASRRTTRNSRGARSSRRATPKTLTGRLSY